MIVPSFLAFAFLRPLIFLHSLTDSNLWLLALWIASGIGPLFVLQDMFYTTGWSNALEVAGIALSMTVNALVTGLIVFRVFKVFQQVKTSTVDSEMLGVTGGSTLQRVIFIIIESGMALFSIQLARLVVATMTTDAAGDAYTLIASIHEMLNVNIRLVIATLFY